MAYQPLGTVAPDALEPADIERIIKTAMSAEPKLTALLRGVLRRLPG